MEERKPLREYKNVTKVFMLPLEAETKIIGDTIGVEQTNFLTTAVHERLPPKTSITVLKDRTVVEFGGVYGEVPEPVTCQVWSSPFGPMLGCYKEEKGG